MLTFNNLYIRFSRDFFVPLWVVNHKMNRMGDIIIVVLGLWVFAKILKVIFGGWSKSDYRRDR